LPSSTTNFELSAYAQDRWLIGNRLLVESGLRFDWDAMVRAPLLSPRLAGTYVLDNSGNTKLSAGIGLVYDPTFLFLIARPYAGERTDYFFNQAGLPTDANGNVVATPTVPTMFSVDRNPCKPRASSTGALALKENFPRPFT
jgi:outer membrane receptor protein involved in Fe transport